MPFIEVNQTRLYYETFGKDRPGQAPILLIHGSTSTGQANWQIVAPLLARRWRVIVPDCRGHGKSANPNHTYSFKEMADDMAALVLALGYQSAHVIGHSNGGNVALVTLLEHPEIIQTAIPQAANAYVSQDLIEHEPHNFDPDRVAREAPEWMRRMIDQHGPTHGPEYWRELLQLTLQETISQPCYTPEDLQKVQRPTLVIQGTQDAVNAPNRHAQFIAHNIPFAEQWLPEGVGHTVHDEILLDWIQHVENFLNRRGTDAAEAIYRLQQQRYPDGRETIFDLQTHAVLARPDTPCMRIEITGKVLTAEQRQAAIEVLEPLAADVSADNVRILMGENTPWGLVCRGVTDIRRFPSTRSERVSQALMGQSLRILEDEGDWAKVRMQHDGYLGWVQNSSILRCSQADVQAYQSACQARVVADLLPASLSPSPTPTGLEQAGKLPFGVHLPVETWQDAQAQVRLPDGRLWWVSSAGLLPYERCPKPNATGIAATLDLIRRFIGIPYLWGGCSPFGYDCSGLAAAAYGFMGIQLPRDADQQFQLGHACERPYQPGDLFFFGRVNEDRPNGRYQSITHVAICLGGDEMIHANGSAWGISYNSLNPEHPLYRSDLRDSLMGVKRYI